MNPIICALDTTETSQALALSQQLSGNVGAVKLGLEFFTANGASGVRDVAKAGLPIFLDLKFHDIPNTVRGAMRAMAGLGVFLTTVHACGGRDMMRAAAEAAAEHGAKRPRVVGVTVLTSMDAQDLNALGVAGNVADQAKRLAALAQEAGLDGVVCSAHEIEALRALCGKDFLLVVPGIRPAGGEHGDQKRVMTPAEALALGADHLVIGRPITEAKDPQSAAKAIALELA